MRNRTFIIAGVVFLVWFSIMAFTAPSPSPIDSAARACKFNGKQLKSYKDTTSGAEFTCE